MLAHPRGPLLAFGCGRLFRGGGCDRRGYALESRRFVICCGHTSLEKKYRSISREKVQVNNHMVKGLKLLPLLLLSSLVTAIVYPRCVGRGGRVPRRWAPTQGRA